MRVETGRLLPYSREGTKVPVTTDTPTNLVVGAGEVYRNQASLGASSGDNVFRIEREIFTPELNGVKGKLLGTDYIKRSEGILETGFPEISAAVLSSTLNRCAQTTTGRQRS